MSPEEWRSARDLAARVRGTERRRAEREAREEARAEEGLRVAKSSTKAAWAGIAISVLSLTVAAIALARTF